MFGDNEQTALRLLVQRQELAAAWAKRLQAMIAGIIAECIRLNKQDGETKAPRGPSRRDGRGGGSNPWARAGPGSEGEPERAPLETPAGVAGWGGVPWRGKEVVHNWPTQSGGVSLRVRARRPLARAPPPAWSATVAAGVQGSRLAKPCLFLHHHTSGDSSQVSPSFGFGRLCPHHMRLAQWGRGVA